MFALSLVDFLSLLLSPSTYFKIFYFCQKYHLKDTYKIFKKFHVGLKFEWSLQAQYWLSSSCERLPFEVFFSCLCDGPLGIAYANMLATTQWPLERAALTSLVCVCVLWLPESLMDLSALWVESYWACHWKKTFWVGGCDGIGGLAYLLFYAAYWSRQSRVFRHLSRSCFYYCHRNFDLLAVICFPKTSN